MKIKRTNWIISTLVLVSAIEFMSEGSLILGGWMTVMGLWALIIDYGVYE